MKLTTSQVRFKEFLIKNDAKLIVIKHITKIAQNKENKIRIVDVDNIKKIHSYKAPNVAIINKWINDNFIELKNTYVKKDGLYKDSEILEYGIKMDNKAT